MGEVFHAVSGHVNANGRIPGAPDKEFQEHHNGELRTSGRFHIAGGLVVPVRMRLWGMDDGNRCL